MTEGRPAEAQPTPARCGVYGGSWGGVGQRLAPRCPAPARRARTAPVCGHARSETSDAGCVAAAYLRRSHARTASSSRAPFHRPSSVVRRARPPSIVCRPLPVGPARRPPCSRPPTSRRSPGPRPSERPTGPSAHRRVGTCRSTLVHVRVDSYAFPSCRAHLLAQARRMAGAEGCRPRVLSLEP